jgi:transposase
LNGSLNQTFYREVCKSLNGRSKESSNESSKKSGDIDSLYQAEYWKESQRNRQKAEKHVHPQRYCKNAEVWDQHQTKLRLDEKIKQTLSILLFGMTNGSEITLPA